MDLLWSETMQLVQLIIPVESDHRSISYLGEFGLSIKKTLIQRRARSNEHLLQPAQIKRCGEMARKLPFFKEQMTKAGLSPTTRSAMSDDVDLDNLEVKLGELEVELNANNEKLQQSYNELIEFKLVVQKHRTLLQLSREKLKLSIGVKDPLTVHYYWSKKWSLIHQSKLSWDLSVELSQEKSLAFERILFRATRGNVFLKQSAVEGPVTEPASGEKVLSVDLEFQSHSLVVLSALKFDFNCVSTH